MINCWFGWFPFLFVLSALLFQGSGMFIKPRGGSWRNVIKSGKTVTINKDFLVVFIFYVPLCHRSLADCYLRSNGLFASGPNNWHNRKHLQCLSTIIRRRCVCKLHLMSCHNEGEHQAASAASFLSTNSFLLHWVRRSKEREFTMRAIQAAFAATKARKQHF